jgi:hypothetical protein
MEWHPHGALRLAYLDQRGIEQRHGCGGFQPAGVSPVPQNQNINNWINPTAFSQPAAYTFGDAPRFLSDLRAPSYFNWDMGLEKWWKFTEAKRLQFRFELYNSLNHPNFFEPNNNLGDTLHFGKITAAYPARSLQFAGKFYF